MANEFQSIESGKGILKDNYRATDRPIYQALKRRNKKRKKKYVEPNIPYGIGLDPEAK